jgi:hypothetical protein
LVHDFVLVMPLLVLLMLVHESLLPFCSNDHTCSFRRAYISWHVSKRDSKISFLNQILHLTNPHDKLSTFVLYPSRGFPSIYRLILWDPKLGHLSPSFHMQDGVFGMEKMRFDDLSLLLEVIETRMVLQILVHGLRFPVLQCNIFTYSVSILIHSLYAYLKCEIALVLA